MTTSEIQTLNIKYGKNGKLTGIPKKGLIELRDELFDEISELTKMQKHYPEIPERSASRITTWITIQKKIEAKNQKMRKLDFVITTTLNKNSLMNRIYN